MSRVRRRCSSILRGPMVGGLVLVVLTSGCTRGDESSVVATVAPLSEAPSSIPGDGGVTSSTTPSVPPTTATASADDSEPEETARQPADPLCRPGSSAPEAMIVDPPYEPGVVRSLVLEMGRQDTRLPVPVGRSSTPVSLSVVEQSEASTVFLWEAGATSLGALGLDDQEIAALGLDLGGLPRQEIRYRIDDDGSFALDNADDVRTQAVTAVDFLLSVFAEFAEADAAAESSDPVPESGEDSDVVDEVKDDETDPFDTGTFDSVRALYAEMSDDELAATFAGEAMALHAYDGLTLELGEQTRSESLLPNLLGGDPFPAEVSLEAAANLDGDGCVSIIEIVRPNPNDLARVVFESAFAAFSPGRTFESLTRAELAELGGALMVEHRTVTQLDPATGWVRRVTATQSVTAGGNEQLRTTIITDVTED